MGQQVSIPISHFTEIKDFYQKLLRLPCVWLTHITIRSKVKSSFYSLILCWVNTTKVELRRNDKPKGPHWRCDPRTHPFRGSKAKDRGWVTSSSRTIVCSDFPLQTAVSRIAKIWPAVPSTQYRFLPIQSTTIQSDLIPEERKPFNMWIEVKLQPLLGFGS